MNAIAAVLLALVIGAGERVGEALSAESLPNSPAAPATDSGQHAEAPRLTETPPTVPTPPFADDIGIPPKTPYQMEVSFKPKEGRTLDDVRSFYLEWASANHWRKVTGEEEAWSKDEWFGYLDMKGRRVQQRMAHWVDPTGKWSVRLAMRDYSESSEQRVFVLLLPFALIQDPK